MVDADKIFANPAASMTSKTRNRLFVLCILAFPFVLFFGSLVSDFFVPLPPIPPLPSPNGYDDFVKAGGMLAANATDYHDLNEGDLRTLVSKNSDTLQLTRTALQKECRVTLDYSATSSAHLDQLAGMKRLAFAFAAEGRLAEMGNRPGDAAKSYLDTIHFGNESTRGGVLIDELVGIAVKAIGTAQLQKIVGQLDSKSCHETAEALETLDSQRQTWNEVLQQEHDWSRRTFPGLQNEMVRVMTHSSIEKAFQEAEQKFRAQQTKTRQLTIDLAARAYELDKGKPPANLADLVPDYLKAVPQDPLTGTNMVYSPR